MFLVDFPLCRHSHASSAVPSCHLNAPRCAPSAEYGFRLSPNPQPQRPQCGYTGDAIGILEASMNTGGQFVVRQLDGIQDHGNNHNSLCLLPLNGASSASNAMIPPSISAPDSQSKYQVLNILNAASSGNGQTTLSNEQKNQTVTMPKLADLDQKPKLKSITHSTMKRGWHISSDQKPFVCATCGKGYKYLCNYRSHCKIHSLVVCWRGRTYTLTLTHSVYNDLNVQPMPLLCVNFAISGLVASPITRSTSASTRYVW